LKEGKSPHPSNWQRLQPRYTEVAKEKEPAGGKSGFIRDNILLQLHNTQSIIRCYSPQLRTAASSTTITTKPATVFRTSGQQTSHQSVLAKM
jgi:hypothetical protein